MCLVCLLYLLASFLISVAVNGDNKVSNSSINMFIIAGAQKSGTTALSAFLSGHPDIYFSKKKEIHFFDKANNYKKGLKHYISNWNNFNSSHLWYGEATPYYIASREACQRISTHFPTAKMIVLLREPVQRAYSEYQMKLRRVDVQNDFFSIMSNHVESFLRCVDSNKKQLQKTTCLPRIILEHPYFAKLKTAMSKSMPKLTWNQVLKRCFPTSTTCPTVTSDGLRTSTLFSSQALCRDSEFGNQTYIQRLMGDLPRRVFAAKSCYSDYRSNYETISPVETALLGEARAFYKCAAYENVAAKSKNGSLTETALRWVNSTISHCVAPKAGISSQYIYRSLYAVQLYHCYKYIPQSQFLILPSEKLRKQPVDILRTVMNFLHLPYNQTWAEKVVSKLDDTVEDRYADFARRTSWRLNSRYEQLDSTMVTKLQSFFHPHNQLLFNLISKNFTGEW